jgi:hypothetical protein
MDELRGKSFDTINSLLMVSTETNALLNTCLDVLISIHLDGKPDPVKDKYYERIEQKLKDYRAGATRLYIESKS